MELGCTPSHGNEKHGTGCGRAVRGRVVGGSVPVGGGTGGHSVLRRIAEPRYDVLCGAYQFGEEAKATEQHTVSVKPLCPTVPL